MAMGSRVATLNYMALKPEQRDRETEGESPLNRQLPERTNLTTSAGWSSSLFWIGEKKETHVVQNTFSVNVCLCLTKTKVVLSKS